MAAKLLFADAGGKIFDHPFLRLAGRSGRGFYQVPERELIPLPSGSELFILPRRYPVGYDPRRRQFITLRDNPYQSGECQAVAAFMAPAHTMSYLAAYQTGKAAPILPLFAYTAVGWKEDGFWVAGWRSDNDIRQDLEGFDCQAIEAGVKKRLSAQPDNRLIKHLSHCALTYGCPAARNLFLGRWEAPLPTSPACNARCLGCISKQANKKITATQQRITFVPHPEEIAEVAAPHLEQAEHGIASFGQGCEGEPMLQGQVLAEATSLIRRRTNRGTLNLNTNGSLPQVTARLVEAGLDSLRISLNSVQPAYYQAYYRPRGYNFADVLSSIRTAKAQGARVALNYLICPGLSDNPAEVQALEALIADTGLDLIQLRNLNIDPDYYLQGINFSSENKPLGMRRMVRRLQVKFPHLKFGYFNPPWK